MESEFDDLTPELQDALVRMLERASGEAGQQTARAVIRRESEIWPLVRQVLEEVRNETKATPAFDLLWTSIRGEVRATIRAALYRKDDEQADEVEQQTAIEVLRKIGEYSIEKGTFLVWVKAIARNLARWRRSAGQQGAEIEPPPDRPNQDRLLPPSGCFKQILSKIQEREPHHAIAFLLHEYLEWSLGSIAAELGDKTVRDLASLVVRQIAEEVKGLKNATGLFARLQMKANALGKVTLAELYGNETAADALSHWCGGVARWMRGQVIGGGKGLLTCVCELRAGTHERLTFLWSRFLRRTLADLCICANGTLLAILGVFRASFPKMSDLTLAEAEQCTEPLRKDIVPGKTLAQCSRGNLADDLVVWRERIQTMMAAQCKDWNVVAYAYLCGALPGIVGPAKGGVA
jgi:DNA-directed RNA polymerase specialized sigma24 family protein